jgi:hypothetical protein
MDTVGYGALAASLTLLAAGWTWFAFRHRGVTAGLRGAALTLLVVAAYLTQAMQLVGRVLDLVARWAVGLVLSPAVWLGIVLAGIAVVLLGASRVVSRRSGSDRGKDQGTVAGRPEAGRLGPASSTRGGGAGREDDDDLAEIEELLRRRGIS